MIKRQLELALKEKSRYIAQGLSSLPEKNSLTDINKYINYYNFKSNKL